MSTSNSSKQDKVTIEDDLDDLLDDALDAFDAPPKQSQPQATTEKSKQKEKEKSNDEVDDLFDDEFVNELAAGMEELMKQMGDEKGFEQSMKDFMSRVETADKKPSNFQEAIQQTMQQLNTSSDQVKDQVNEEDHDFIMTEMMKQMEQLADSGEFDQLVEGMMDQLMKKDILYEPMKELAEKYPNYLSQNKDKLSKEDYEKYQLQYSYIQQIVEHFESQNNGEEATSTDPKIIDLMEKMQACGQPPQALLEELAPDMKFDQDGIPQPEQCTIM